MINKEEIKQRLADNKKAIRKELDDSLIKKLISEGVLKQSLYCDMWYVTDTPLIMTRQNDKYWIKSMAFYYILDQSELPLVDYWPTVDIKKLEEKARELGSNNVYKK